MKCEMRKYIIIPLRDVTRVMIDSCIETSLETLRVSKDGNTILKFNNQKPNILPAISREYSEKEIHQELEKEEWLGVEELSPEGKEL